MTQPAASLKRTALNDVHRASGAKMVDFGGWDMPVQYSGLVDEHHAVRKAVGIFDVIHMGGIEIRGPEAQKLVDHVSTNNAAKLNIGQAQYSGLLYDHGGFVDDILVHKVAPDHFFICVNASNQEKDFEHIRDGNRFDAVVEFTRSGVRARAVTAGGESGHPQSPHFNDEALRYASGALRDVYFYPAQLKGHTERAYHPGR